MDGETTPQTSPREARAWALARYNTYLRTSRALLAVWAGVAVCGAWLVASGGLDRALVAVMLGAALAATAWAVLGREMQRDCRRLGIEDPKTVLRQMRRRG